MLAMRSRILLLAVSLLAAALLLGADDAPPGRHVRGGERLRISVVGLMGEGVETRLLRRVGDDGSLRLPMLDADALDASGMTAGELERELTRRYERQTTKKDLLVVVSRIDLGEDHAMTPGRNDLIGDPTAEGMAPSPPAFMSRALPESTDLSGLSARDALLRVGAAYKLPLVVNWPSMEAAGVDRETKLDLTLPAGTRADRALSLVLDQLGGGGAALGWTDYDGAVIVGTQELVNSYVETAVFDVRRLLAPKADAPEGQSPEERVDRLKTIITTTVASDAWQDNGGVAGKIAELDGQLVVTATPQMLRDVAKLLEVLRGG